MMDVVIWIVTGVLVGWVARVAMRSRMEFGWVGNLVTGSLGALIGGWLLRLLGVTDAQGWPAHIGIGIVGAMVLLGSLRLLRQAASASGPAVSHLVPVADLESQIARLGELERRIWSNVLRRQPTAVDPNRSFDAQLSVGERVADRVASFGGSWTFIGLFLMGMIVWMAVNQELARPFDPYPFILLNLALSCVAALQAPIIMMSQNRQAAKDRSDARLDYEVNVRAEMQIAALHEKLDGTRTQDLSLVIRSLDEQRARLEAIEKRLAARGA